MNRSNILDYSELKQFVKSTPLGPGVYLMKNREGHIIYVGKAKVLRHRLASYFNGPKDIKTRTLLSHLASIETILVSNEYEALLLENTLIKQHSPRYNINLKDGKTYPVVRITNEPFPRVFKTRYIVQDGSEYYGPYPNVGALENLLDIIKTLFPLRHCKTLKKREHPCLYYHMGRCSAPCAGKIDARTYATYIEQVRELLSGKTEKLLQDLKEKMEEAATRLAFEEAARYRDAIRHIEELSHTNAVVDFDPQARDYITWASEGVYTVFSVFSMREGKLIGRELYRTRSAAETSESVQQFLLSYYHEAHRPPPFIFFQEKVEGLEDVCRFFTETFDEQPCFFFGPEQNINKEEAAEKGNYYSQDQRHRAILALAQQNAKEELIKLIRERGEGPALQELQRVLQLPALPYRIEGFDVAHLGGRHTVASLISFVGGKPDKKNYRYFKIRTLKGKIDDYEALREALSRRYSRLRAEEAELPDLILIDGGLGQVNAAQTILTALGLTIPVVGLAKQEEELWLPAASSPIRLDQRSEALRLLQFIRDETHRFATGLNQRLRSRDLQLSTLEAISGIGKKRAAHLMRTFGSLENLRKASFEEILPHVEHRTDVARAVVEALQGSAQSTPP
ncbi:MAG: excinuclease ABC subunit UvrC [Treponemataceae bacterium]|nr:excinuclease ABC subunit UvrC [Treponemataceae bacterium]